MLYVNVALFALAAALGIVVFSRWLSLGKTPKAIVYAHGVFAAAGLVVLILNVLKNPAHQLRTSLILFLIAAVGGFIMFFRDLRLKGIPVGLVVVHALLAVTAFIILLTVAF